MEQLVDENAGEIGGIAAERGLEQNAPVAQQRSGVNRTVAAQVVNETDADGIAVKRRNAIQDPAGAHCQAKMAVLEDQQGDSVSKWHRTGQQAVLDWRSVIPDRPPARTRSEVNGTSAPIAEDGTSP